MMRATDPAQVNALVARDFPEGADFTQVLAEPLHVCLIEDGNGALFMWRGPGIYEVHVFFAARGREAINLGHRMLGWMRIHREAEMFWAAIPVESLKVKMFTRLMGWKSRGLVEMQYGTHELFVSEKRVCLQ